MGNHALVKACNLLGIKAHVTHRPWNGETPTNHIFIKRDPRNTLVSWLRHTGKPITQGMFICGLADYDGKPFAQTLDHYANFLDDPKTLVIKYESLILNDLEMRRIAGHFGVPFLDDAFANLPGGTNTWRGDHCNYHAIWSPAVAQAWNDAGGAELLTRWGY
jgi:hypothetical protein